MRNRIVIAASHLQPWRRRLRAGTNTDTHTHTETETETAAASTQCRRGTDACRRPQDATQTCRRAEIVMFVVMCGRDAVA